MGKPALGKGMRDLIAKNFGVETRDEASADRQKALEELELIRSRYGAQGYDVSYLDSLKDLPLPEISSGLDAFRISVKALAGAQTQLRSLEGYGYTKEIEAINTDIKNPLKAEEVLRKVEELKDRALSEHNITMERKDTQRVKLPESLKMASKKLRPDMSCRPDEDEIDPKCLDELLVNLDSLSSALSSPDDADPLMLKIVEWETKGYFVDRLKTAYSEGREVAEIEVKRFEEDLEELEKLKERYRSMDLRGFDKERLELDIRFQYPHLWFEIKTELDRLSSILGSKEGGHEQAVPEKVRAEAEVQAATLPIEDKASMRTELPKAPVPIEGGPEKLTKPSGPKEEVEKPPAPQEKVTIPEQEVRSPPPVEAPDAPPQPPMPELTTDELMEKAKEAYSQDRFDDAIALFKQALVKDPENSKAKFMIKRITSKMG